MKDLISRKAAIRWVMARCNPYGESTIDYVSGISFIKHLEQMPPAQVEPTFEQIKKYCKRRRLTIITNDLYQALISNYSAQTALHGAR